MVSKCSIPVLISAEIFPAAAFPLAVLVMFWKQCALFQEMYRNR